MAELTVSYERFFFVVCFVCSHSFFSRVELERERIQFEVEKTKRYLAMKRIAAGEATAADFIKSKNNNYIDQNEHNEQYNNHTPFTSMHKSHNIVHSIPPLPLAPSSMSDITNRPAFSMLRTPQFPPMQYASDQPVFQTIPNPTPKILLTGLSEGQQTRTHSFMNSDRKPQLMQQQPHHQQQQQLFSPIPAFLHNHDTPVRYNAAVPDSGDNELISSLPPLLPRDDSSPIMKLNPVTTTTTVPVSRTSDIASLLSPIALHEQPATPSELHSPHASSSMIEATPSFLHHANHTPSFINHHPTPTTAVGATKPAAPSSASVLSHFLSTSPSPIDISYYIRDLQQRNQSMREQLHQTNNHINQITNSNKAIQV